MKHEAGREELQASARRGVWMAESLVTFKLTIRHGNGAEQSTLTILNPQEVFMGIYWRSDCKWDRKAIMTFSHML